MVTNTRELSLGKSLRRLNRSAINDWCPQFIDDMASKGREGGKNLHSLTASKQLHKKCELKPFMQRFIPRQCSKPEPIARLVLCTC